MLLPPVFERFHAEIEAEIKSVIDERHSPLYNMMRYHFGWITADNRPAAASNGKAVRPTLCLLACQAGGGDYAKALPAAAALELVHNYSLIHDDIQDDDVERRHRPTVWQVWGKPQAINAGTAMRMLANVSVRRLQFPIAKQARIQALLDEATIRLIEGQYLDISFESRSDVTTAEYLNMVGCKTAALMSCSLETGAELAGCSGAVVRAYRELGWNLGMAFQIKDDVLGIWGHTEQTGKPSGNDIRRRKKTFPVIYGMQRASERPEARILADYWRMEPNEQNLQAVMEALESVGASDEAERVTSEYIASSTRIVESLDMPDSVRADFMQVIDFLKTRRF